MESYFHERKEEGKARNQLEGKKPAYTAPCWWPMLVCSSHQSIFFLLWPMLPRIFLGLRWRKAQTKPSLGCLGAHRPHQQAGSRWSYRHCFMQRCMQTCLSSYCKLLRQIMDPPVTPSLYVFLDGLGASARSWRKQAWVVSGQWWCQSCRGMQWPSCHRSRGVDGLFRGAKMQPKELQSKSADHVAGGRKPAQLRELKAHCLWGRATLCPH